MRTLSQSYEFILQELFLRAGRVEVNIKKAKLDMFLDDYVYTGGILYFYCKELDIEMNKYEIIEQNKKAQS